HDERVGLWMELLRGATLEQQLAAHGSFSAREATLVGIDLCGALAAIHAAGLIHRDVKAQNVMREAGGRIVLMDLGTGREADGRGLRAVPELAGTPLYLAPEIFLGAPASARTDLYSLGVLLYHLVTGSFPVRATTMDELEAALVESLGEAAAAPAAALPPTAPTQAAERPSSAARIWTRAGLIAASIAVLIVLAFVGWPALRRLGSRYASGSGIPAGAVRSIAVLPLANLSGDPAEEYFADGITDELIGTLGRLGGVNVISRTSTMQFKGSPKTVPEIARALNVDAVLEGSVRMLGAAAPGG